MGARGRRGASPPRTRTAPEVGGNYLPTICGPAAGRTPRGAAPRGPSRSTADAPPLALCTGGGVPACPPPSPSSRRAHGPANGPASGASPVERGSSSTPSSDRATAGCRRITSRRTHAARPAHRTSPTNIGMSLLAVVGAWDLGYIGPLGLVGAGGQHAVDHAPSAASTAATCSIGTTRAT